MSRISIRQLALKLKADQMLVRGVVVGLGVRMDRTPSADFIVAKDAEKVRRRLDAYRRQPEPVVEPAAETAAP